MKQAFVEKRFSSRSQNLINWANEIIEEYEASGYELTLRQIYYQFVSRNLLANTERNYKRLGDIIANGRLAGLVDWDAISDRTRFLRDVPHWNNPREVALAAVSSYHLDRWEGAGVRPEVWIEKDALVGVIEGVCTKYDVGYLSCRGYLSLSLVYAAAQRIARRYAKGQQTLIIHFGDHDPSGLDMSRDINDRLRMMLPAKAFTLTRRALNMDDVRKYNPPPNPAKETDSRHAGYKAEHGTESWELDSLAPDVIARMVEAAIGFLLTFPDIRANYDRQARREKRGRRDLKSAALSVTDKA